MCYCGSCCIVLSSWVRTSPPRFWGSRGRGTLWAWRNEPSTAAIGAPTSRDTSMWRPMRSAVESGSDLRSVDGEAWRGQSGPDGVAATRLQNAQTTAWQHVKTHARELFVINMDCLCFCAGVSGIVLLKFQFAQLHLHDFFRPAGTNPANFPPPNHRQRPWNFHRPHNFVFYTDWMPSIFFFSLWEERQNWRFAWNADSPAPFSNAISEGLRLDEPTKLRICHRFWLKLTGLVFEFELAERSCLNNFHSQFRWPLALDTTPYNPQPVGPAHPIWANKTISLNHFI